MNKKIIAAAVAATFAAPAAFASDVTVYGKLRQAIDFVDAKGADETQITDYASRLGFKGSEDLGNGLKAIYQMEWDVEISEANDSDGDEFAAGSTQFSGRNSFVGLSGDFGTVVLGRHDHPLKMSTGSLDIFGDTIADNASFTKEGQSYQAADLRANGALAYISPNFSGLTLAGALVPGENSSADGISDAWSVAAMYSNAGLFVALAYEEGDEDLDQLGAGSPSATDYEQTRLGLGYTMDAFHVNFVYTDQEGAGADFDSYKIAGKYTMGNNAIKAQYFDRDNDTGSDSDGWAVGLEHNFSKRTQAQIVYSEVDQSGSTSGGSPLDGDVFSLQMNHSF